MEIPTPLGIAVHFHGRLDSKTTPAVLLAKGEVSLSRLPILVSLLSQ